jgi:signal transduction histidine kinase
MSELRSAVAADTSEFRPPGWRGWAASLLLALAFAARVFERYLGQAQWPLAAGLLLAFLALFAGALPAMARLPARAIWLRHLYFGAQCALVVGLMGVPPHPDVVAALFVALGLQTPLLLSRRSFALWIGGLMLLTIGTLVYWMGGTRGLELALIPAVGCVALPAFVLAQQELEAARAQSQALLDELREAHVRLEAATAQAEELATLEERNRLARQLHDSVSQTIFSLSLNVRAARHRLEREPANLPQLRLQLEKLQTLAAAALADVRALIERYRPSPSA